MRYRVTFWGRLAGAIGITYRMVEIVLVPRREDVLPELYRKGYEHISIVAVEPLDSGDNDGDGNAN